MPAAADAARRRRPSPLHADYVHLRILDAQLRLRALEALAGRADLRLLDVGCGGKPYRDVFAPMVTDHVGLDRLPGPDVDVLGSADALPVPDASFDVLLCTQALQYVDDPLHVAREFARVLRPGGVAFVSTHGTSPFDGGARDRWRFTHAGLAHVFGVPSGFASAAVHPGGGTGSALAWVAGWHLHGIASRLGRPAASGPVVFALQLAGWTADRLVRRAVPDRAPDASPNYLVVARRAAA